ncbi:hypothetical protein VHEMI09194 [[Torrubiella] hemipterigena]|uniref:Uncharacterized protein n=1 Tax=[Torrubiella] hemipterigena TaxID=1531966 RepID=A0A0A1T926_9HYPO|nr:hypothetical protein VHEMI09194 [[Torrubiella] hemipterigena]
METETPGIFVDMKVDPTTLAKTMNVTSGFPNITDPEVMAMFILGLGSKTPLQFTIGQPKDPKWENSKETQFGRVIDTGSPFLLVGRMYDIRTSAQRRDERLGRYADDKEHKWKLGVGLGVGLGVPVVMIMSFCFGKATGKNVRAASSGATPALEK